MKDIRLSVLDEIRQGYYGLLLANRAEKVREQELERTQLFLRQAKGFYQVGLKPRIDVTQAELQLIQAQKALLKAKNDFLVSKVNLQKSLGLDNSPDYTLKDDLEADQVQWNLEDLKKEALAAQPTLNRLRTLVQYWEAQVKAAERGFLAQTVRNSQMGPSQHRDPPDRLYGILECGGTIDRAPFSGFESRARLDEFRAALKPGQGQCPEPRIAGPQHPGKWIFEFNTGRKAD